MRPVPMVAVMLLEIHVVVMEGVALLGILSAATAIAILHDIPVVTGISVRSRRSYSSLVVWLGLSPC